MSQPPTQTSQDILPGRFITLEGTEGVGKSSNLNQVCTVLEQAGIPFIQTREPGGTEVAERLRQILLQETAEEILSLTELLVVFAARAQHLAHVIAPSLARGEWVVCDRFTDATFAYQGYARGVDLAQVAALEEWVQQGLQPDLTILLDLDPQIAMARIADRAKDRMEQEQLRFYETVRHGYLQRAAQHSRFRVIDAGVPLSQVAAQVTSCVNDFVRTVQVESSTA